MGSVKIGIHRVVPPVGYFGVAFRKGLRIFGGSC